MVKPARAYGGIHFCRVPYQIMLIFQYPSAAKICILCMNLSFTELRGILLLAVLCNFLGIPGTSRYNTPLRLPGISGFITAPADIRTTYINACFRLQSPDRFIISLPVIILLFSVWTFSTGSVKPNCENRSISRQQLGQLIYKVIIIFLPCPIKLIIPAFLMLSTH